MSIYIYIYIIDTKSNKSSDLGRHECRNTNRNIEVGLLSKSGLRGPMFLTKVCRQRKNNCKRTYEKQLCAPNTKIGSFLFLTSDSTSQVSLTPATYHNLSV